MTLHNLKNVIDNTSLRDGLISMSVQTLSFMEKDTQGEVTSGQKVNMNGRLLAQSAGNRFWTEIEMTAGLLRM